MNKDNPLVSICCLTYNHEKYIRDAIDGFLSQQTSFPFEIIIHDDASTDETVSLVKEYVNNHADKFVTIFQSENQYSKGIKPIFEYVFPKAHGKYVALCEGDDYWIDPYKLQKQVDFLERNEDYGLIHTDHDFLNLSTGKRLRNYKSKIKIKDGDQFETLLVRNLVSTLTAVARRDLLLNAVQKHKKHLSTWRTGDYPLWLEISHQSKIKYLNTSTAVYRFGRGSVSNPSSRAARLTFLSSIHEISRYFHHFYMPQRNDILHQIEYRFAQVMFSESFLDGNINGVKHNFQLMKKNKQKRLPIFVLIKYYFTILSLYQPAIMIDKLLKRAFIKK